MPGPDLTWAIQRLIASSMSSVEPARLIRTHRCPSRPGVGPCPGAKSTPGVIATPMALGFLDAAEDRDYRERHMTGAQLLPRLGDPAEVARVACFLASDDASFVTGGVYEVDGGMLAWRGLRA